MVLRVFVPAVIFGMTVTACSPSDPVSVGDPQPQCTIQHASSINFGTIQPGDTRDSTVTITNTGGRTLSGAVSTDQCNGFSIVSGDGPFSLGAGEMLTLTVRFAPGESGQHSCTINTDNTLCGSINCTGVGGQPPVCTVVPTSVDMDTVTIGSVKDATVTIKNAGGGTLSGVVSELACDDFSIVAGAGPYALEPGDSALVTVRFQPTSSGTHLCTIATGSTECGNVVCTGIGDPPPSCSIDPVEVEFGGAEVGAWRDTTITISNVGGGTLNGTVSLSSSDHYSILSGAGPYALGGSGSLPVTIRFAPTSTGVHQCLVLAGNLVCDAVALMGRGFITPQFVLSWDIVEGSGDGELLYPNDFAYDATSGDLYVADSGNDRIQKFTTGGAFVLKWGVTGSANGQFTVPRGVAVGPTGDVLVVDGGNARIQRFDNNGNWLETWGSYGSMDGQFYDPRGIAVDSQRNVYVADRENRRIQKFRWTGTSYEFALKWDFLYPMHLAVGPDGVLFATQADPNRPPIGSPPVYSYELYKFDDSGNFIDKWGVLGTEDGQIQGIGYFTVDSEGLVYVADAFHEQVQIFDANGLFLTKFGVKGMIAVDENVNVYVMSSTQVRKYK